jgi:hypothetical protein
MKMKNIKRLFSYCVSLVGISACLSSCNSDVDFGEQYRKTVYMVHADNMLRTVEHSFNATDNRMVFSVYCASSEPIENDLTVRVRIDPHALDSLNAGNLLENPLYVNKLMLPAANYDFSGNADIVIRAGEQYGVLEIPLSLAGLSPDSAYVLPVSIVSNSAGYDINPLMKSVVYEIVLVNNFSGNFSGTSAESSKTIYPVQPAAKAVSANSVRMPVHTLSADIEYLDTHFMLLTVADNRTVSIEPWANADIVDLGGSYYDEARQFFELHYRFTDETGKMYSITEKITNILAPKENE